MENYRSQILVFTAHCSTERDIYALFSELSSSGKIANWAFSIDPLPYDSRPYFFNGSETIVVTKSSIAENCAHSSNVFPHDNNHDYASANSCINDLASTLNSTQLISCSVHKPHFI